MSEVIYETQKNGVYISFEALDVDNINETNTTVVGFTVGNRGGLISTDVVGYCLVAIETGHWEVLSQKDQNLSAFRNDLVRENAISCDEYIASGGEKETYDFLTSIYREL